MAIKKTAKKPKLDDVVRDAARKTWAAPAPPKVYPHPFADIKAL